MKFLFSFVFLFFFFSNADIIEIRKTYPTALNSETAAKEFASNFSENVIENNQTIQAYKGASIIILAKFKKKIANKIKHFKEGAKLIETAIDKESNNIELRLIRLSIQENAPKIIKYNKNKTEDVAFILKHYNEQTTVLKEYLKKFILQSKSFTDVEKQTIK